MNPSGGDVERKLADRNPHPANAKIAEAEDALVVCHYDQSRLAAASGVV